MCFLGFKFGVKGYKVLNLSTQQIQISRDVHFYEINIPFLRSKPILPPAVDDHAFATFDDCVLHNADVLEAGDDPISLNADIFYTSVHDDTVDVLLESHLPASVPDSQAVPIVHTSSNSQYLRQSSIPHLPSKHLESYDYRGMLRLNSVVSHPHSKSPYLLSKVFSFSNMSATH